MQNGRKVQNSPTILLLSQLLYNVNLMTLGSRIATAFPVRNCAGVPALNHKASVINRHEQPED